MQKLILVEHSKLKFKILSISLSLPFLIKRISDADKNFVDYHSPRCGKLLILMALKEVMIAIDRKGEREGERGSKSVNQIGSKRGREHSIEIATARGSHIRQLEQLCLASLGPN